MSTQSMVEERVVGLRFDKKGFEKEVKGASNALDKLNYSVDKLKGGFSAMAGGVSIFAGAIKKVTFDPLARGAEMSIGKLMALTAALTGVSNVADEVYRKITQTIKSMSSDQVAAGWNKYSEYTQSIQTILSATKKEGETSEEALERVNSQVERLLWFADETSYSLTDMTSNVGKFTSQGVELETAVTAMQGISTWAAAAGQNAPEASRAMYNLSQALAQGSVKLMDWRSIENANMATKQFKELVIEAAVARGSLKKVGNEIQTLSGKSVTFESFNAELSEGWFTKDVLMDVLNQYGEYANIVRERMLETGKTASRVMEDLEKEGIAAEHAIGAEAFKMAQAAITFEQAIDATKDAVSTQFLRIFQAIFGNYLEAKELWTDLANDLWDIFAGPLDRLAEAFEWWSDLKYANSTLDSAFKIIYAIWDVVEKLIEVVGDVFDTKIEWHLKMFAENFRLIGIYFEEYVQKKILGNDKIWDNLTVFFTSIKTALESIKKLFEVIYKRYLSRMLGQTDTFIESVTYLLTKLAEVLDNITTYIDETDLFNSIFDNIEKVISTILTNIKKVKDTITETLESLSKYMSSRAGMPSGVSAMLDATGRVIDVADLAGDTIIGVIDGIGDAISSAVPFIIKFWDWLKGSFADAKKMFEKMGEWFKKFGEYINKNLLQPMFDQIGIGMEQFKGQSFAKWFAESNNPLEFIQKVITVIGALAEALKKLKKQKGEGHSKAGIKGKEGGMDEVFNSIETMLDRIQPIAEKANKLLSVFTGSKSALDAVIKLMWNIILQTLIIVYGVNLIKERFAKQEDADAKQVKKDRPWWMDLLGIPNDAFTQLTGALGECKEIVEKIGKTSIGLAKTMLAITSMIVVFGGIALLGGILVMLSTMPWQNILIGLVAVGVLVAFAISTVKVLEGGATRIAELASNKDFAKNMAVFGLFMFLFATAIMEMAIALAVVSNYVDIDKSLGPMIGIVIMLGAVAGVATVVSGFGEKFKPSAIIAGGVVAFLVSKSVLEIAKAMVKISRIEHDKFAQAEIAVVSIISLLGIYATLGTQLVNDQTAARAIISMGVLAIMMAVSTLGMAGAMVIVGRIPETEIKQAGVVIGAIYTALAAFVAGASVLAKWLSKDDSSMVSLGIIAGIVVLFAGVVVLLGFALSQITKVTTDTNAMMAAAAAISGVVVAIATVLVAMAKILTEVDIGEIAIIGGSLTTILLSLSLLAIAAAKLAEIPASDLWKAVGAIAALLVIVSLMVAGGAFLVTKMQLVGAVIIALAVAIGLIAMGLGLLAFGIAMLVKTLKDMSEEADKSEEKMSKFGRMISNLLDRIFGDIGVYIGQFVAGLVSTFGKILDTLSESGILGKLKVFLTKLTHTIKAYLDDNFDAIKEAIDMILSGILEIIIHLLDEYGPQIIDKLDMLVTDLLNRIDNNLKIFGVGITTTIVMIIMSIINTLKSVRNSLLDLTIGTIFIIMNGIAAMALKFGVLAMEIVFNFIDGLLLGISMKAPATIEQFILTVIDLINALADAIDEHTDELINAVERLLISMANAFQKWVNMNIRVGGMLYNMGVNIVTGVINGIVSKIPLLNRVMSNLGTNNVIAPFAKAVDSNSPSKEMYKQGVYVDEGLAGGIKSGASDLKSLVGGLGTSIISTFTESFGDPSTLISNFFGSMLQGITGSFQGFEGFDMSNMLGEFTNINPVITPELDLSNIEAGAGKISSLIDQEHIQDISGSFTAPSTGLDSVSLQNGMDEMFKKFQNYIDVQNYNNAQPTTNVNITLDTTAKKVLKVVKNENDKQYKATGVDKLAPM